MRIKGISSILSRLIDLTLLYDRDGINDFTAGSTIRSIYEAIAMEIEQYYVLGRDNIIWGIGEGITEAFNFPRRQARRAYGTVTLEFHTALRDDLHISQGTNFMSSFREYNQRYETLQDFTIPKGVSRYDITVYCVDNGSYGNVPKGVINMASIAISNLSKVHNPYDLLTGQDTESLEDVRRRFRMFVDTRGRATNKAIAYGARTVEDIAGVYVDESTGYVKVYAHDNNGFLSDDLKSQVEYVLRDYRPSGIKLEVFPVERRVVNLTVKVQLRSAERYNEIFKREIESVLRSYLNRLNASEDVILNDLIQKVMEIDDYEIYDVNFVNLAGNIAVEPNEIVRAGTVDVQLTTL